MSHKAIREADHVNAYGAMKPPGCAGHVDWPECSAACTAGISKAAEL